MLLVDHYIAPSPVHGLGVFARTFIPAGTKAWQAHPAIDREIPRAELDTLPPHVVSTIRTRAEYIPERDVFRLAADGDAYMNHCDSPNLVDAGDSMYAARDIEAGEELFCDYRVVRVAAFDPDQVPTRDPARAAAGG
ncbi:SET domain-containing protein [Cereibacter sphaeroides]|uniref:SET domain-containing protein n=1 Tax=Cereibacter sphaeroides TaxID=1063 RepID=UPI001F3B0AF0|nr:SET domain-containing protein [Cereibacter sphaeroides]MCE6959297.1 SET domain-containing protein [Cereibacter sphaeroides]MCE6972889.1 SET domain-containing protein [Cereibacter sphaeroides]